MSATLDDVLNELKDIKSKLATPLPVVTQNRDDFRTNRLINPNPGQPVQLPKKPIPDGFAVTVKASRNNAAIVYLSNTTQDASLTSTSSFRLAKNEAVELRIKNLDRVWFDVDTANDGVEWIMEE